MMVYKVDIKIPRSANWRRKACRVDERSSTLWINFTFTMKAARKVVQEKRNA